MTRFRSQWTILLVTASLTGCLGEGNDQGRTDSNPPHEQGDWHSVISPDAWQITESGADPLIDHRTDARTCPETAWYAEQGGIEIETTECAYLSLSQPVARDLAAGDRLRIQAWWQTLVSTELAQGHLAVLIGDELLWDEWVDIPGPADARDIELTVTTDAPAGTPVTLHLHNHGYNTWTLADIALWEPL